MRLVQPFNHSFNKVIYPFHLHQPQPPPPVIYTNLNPPPSPSPTLSIPTLLPSSKLTLPACKIAAVPTVPLSVGNPLSSSPRSVVRPSFSALTASTNFSKLTYPYPVWPPKLPSSSGAYRM